MGAIYSRISSYFWPPPPPPRPATDEPEVEIAEPPKPVFRAPPETPLTKKQRFINICVNNYRGIIGFIVPPIMLLILGLTAMPFKKDAYQTVLLMWMWMFWYFLFVPVSPPVTGVIPIFTLPALGVMKTATVCKCYFNEMICLWIVGGWLAMSLNNSHFDKRASLWLIATQSDIVNPISLLLRSTLAAFLLSMFCSNRLVSKHIIGIVAPSLYNLITPGKNKDNEPNFGTIRDIICLSISTGAAIGGTAILSASISTLCAMAIWALSEKGKLYNVNFLEYSLFAFPTAVGMLVVTLIYYIVLLKILVKKPITPVSQKTIATSIKTHHGELPAKSMTGQEIISLMAVFTSMVLYFTRRNRFFGWAPKRIKDATISTIFAILLHIVPKNIGFIRLLQADRESKLKLKPASSVLFFKFIDTLTYYGYFLLIGGGIALNQAVKASYLDLVLQFALYDRIKNLSWWLLTFLVCFATWVLSTVMHGTAAVVVVMPLIINVGFPNAYLLSVAIGIIGSIGFVLPYCATPAYYCKKEGKVTVRHMIQYGILHSFLCMIVVWLALQFLAAKVFEIPNEVETTSSTTTTSEAPPAGP